MKAAWVLGLGLVLGAGGIEAAPDVAAYAARLYHDVLHREVGPEEVRSVIARVGAGTPLATVAREVVDSVERRRNVIARDVERYLRRPVQFADERDGQALFARGASREDIVALILSSPEYAYLHGNNAVIGAQGLYEDLLGRRPGDEETSALATELAAGSARDAAYQLLKGAEFRSRLLGAWYQKYLHRAPDAPGLRYWLDALSKGQSWETVQVGFLSSDEYQSLPPATIRAAPFLPWSSGLR